MRSVRLADVSDLDPVECELPPRSVLYRIPPLGLGTGQAEGLLSYLVRLAAAHSVNPRRLVREVFASDSPEFAKLYSSGFFIRYGGTINGLGKYAELFLEETGRLTGADFLRPMCLLPLQDLLPHNGAGLLARHPTWCPACIGEMEKSGDDVYRPLAWSFELYRFCTRHSVRMQETCAHCCKAQPIIPRYPDLGRCDHCGRLLSDGNASRSEARLDRWASAAVEDVVRHLPELDGLATADNFAAFVKTAVAKLADGNRAKFCELIGLPRWAMTKWMTRGERPTLPQLLSICYGLGIMPSELFLRKPDQARLSMNENICPVPEKLIGREERPLLSALHKQALASELRRTVNDTEDTRPLAAVAETLNLTRSCLKYWFSEECAAIVAQHESATKLRTEANAQSGREAVIEAVCALMACGEYPSRRKVNAALRAHKVSLARADMLLAYRQAIETNDGGRLNILTTSIDDDISDRIRTTIPSP